MDCNETRCFLDAHADGELDLVRHIEVDAHLRSCPDCAALAENARARRAALREQLPRFAAPTALAEKIRTALRAEGASVTPVATPAPDSPAAVVRVAPAAPRRGVLFSPAWTIAGLAASIAFAVLTGFAWGGARARANFLADAVIADHVRSLQVDHLTDVTSTDQHTVKPWFAGKLDFSPPVTDLKPAGFPLVGGRLEHFDGRPAAALVFQRRQHVINLLIWPAGGAALSSRRLERNGYHTEAWSAGGLNFLAVSEIPDAELARFAQAFRDAQP